jgi:hypothetical protein
MPLKNRSRPRQVIYLLAVGLILGLILVRYGHGYF